MNKILETQKKIEEGVASGYKAIENGVVSGYKVIEDGVVGGYKKIEDKFVETFFDTDPRDRKPDDKNGQMNTKEGSTIIK